MAAPCWPAVSSADLLRALCPSTLDPDRAGSSVDKSPFQEGHRYRDLRTAAVFADASRSNRGGSGVGAHRLLGGLVGASPCSTRTTRPTCPCYELRGESHPEVEAHLRRADERSSPTTYTNATVESTCARAPILRVSPWLGYNSFNPPRERNGERRQCARRPLPNTDSDVVRTGPIRPHREFSA
jgi:hypothetical protein